MLVEPFSLLVMSFLFLLHPNQPSPRDLLPDFEDITNGWELVGCPWQVCGKDHEQKPYSKRVRRRSKKLVVSQICQLERGWTLNFQKGATPLN